MTNLEPVNSRKDNLTPRAKIGDVVMVHYWRKRVKPTRLTVDEVNECDPRTYGGFKTTRKNSNVIRYVGLYDKDILKNLTTNISYE